MKYVETNQAGKKIAVCKAVIGIAFRYRHSIAISSLAAPAVDVNSATMKSGSRKRSLSVHFIVRFEPIAGKEAEFRRELLRVVEASRTEIGCLAIRAFESVREPTLFAIHSEWVDEATFDLHSKLTHTVGFVAAAQELLTHPIEGLRSRSIGGGAGAGAPR
jgi:quinol monooxygenase YgiN